MSSNTTPETTQRLKAAGFPIPPQPEPISLPTGQVIVFDGGMMATDILKELGMKWSLCYRHTRWRCESDSAIVPGIMNFTGHSSYKHDNPAEACALAWLAINEK